MKKYLFLFCLLAVLCSCNSEQQPATNNEVTTTEPIVDKKPPTETSQQNQRLTVNCSTDNNNEITSELENLAKRLESLENNYQLKEIGPVQLKNSSLYNALKQINKRASGVSKLPGIDLANFEQIVEQTNYCFVKGTVDLGGRMFARAGIEEIVFKSADCAIQFEQHLTTIRSSGHHIEDFDKAPHSIFRKGDKIYFVISGGAYMMDMYERIAAKMQ